MIKTAFTEEDAKYVRENTLIKQKPFYEPQGNELEIIKVAHEEGMGVALFGPTGTGKTRLVQRAAFEHQGALLEVNGNESVTATTVIGSIYVIGGESQFVPGSAYKAVKIGGWLYLDELLRMNQDVQTGCFPLTDKRRTLKIEDTGEVTEAPKEFQFIYSTNPGKQYQQAGKPTFPPPNFAQRCTGIHLGYQRGEHGITVITREANVDRTIAKALDNLAQDIDKMYNGQEYAGRLPESVGYHALINAAKLIHGGIRPHEACHSAISLTLSPHPDVIRAIDELIKDRIKV